MAKMDTYDPGITKIKSIGAIQLCETRNLFVNLYRWAPLAPYVVSEVIVKKIEAICSFTCFEEDLWPWGPYMSAVWLWQKRLSLQHVNDLGVVVNKFRWYVCKIY